MSVRSVDVSVTLPISQPYDVVGCEIEEAISFPTRAVVRLSATDELDLDGSSMAVGVVALLLDGVAARTWALRVDRVAYVGLVEGAHHYDVTLRAALHFQDYTQNVRKFRKRSAEEIIRAVLGEASVEHGFALQRPTPRRNYCVQYHESNLAFVERLAEFEGIYYTIDADGAVRFADRSSAEPEVEGESHFELLDAAGALDRDALGIHEFGVAATVRTGKATLNDHDWKKPSLSLLTSQAADVDAELEEYVYPAGFRNPDDGAYLARVRLEAHRVPSRTASGTGNAPSFAPARAFTFGASAGPEFAGDYLLVKVVHRVQSASFQGGTRLTYQNDFEAIPRSVPFRPALRRPRPVVLGNHTAMVRGPAGEEIHTDAWGRFRAQFHWDREAVGTDEDSRWLRMLQEVGSGMVLARVGWEVNVGYVDGDPDRPLGLSRNINGVMTPNYGQPAKKTMMTIKTPTYKGAGFNEWRMDDTGSSMTMDVRAQRNFNVLVQHDRTETIGANEDHTILYQYQRNVNKTQKVSVGANVDFKTADDKTVQVGRDRKMSVSGSESVKVGKDRKETVHGNDSEKVGGLRLTIAGSVSVEIPALEKAKSILANPGGAAASAASSVAGAAAKGAASGAGAALGGTAGAALQGVGQGQSFKDAAKGALGSALSGVTSGGAGSSGGGAGGPGSFFGGLSAAGSTVVGQGASVGGVAQGALTGALGAAKQSVQSMIPSADQMKESLKPKIVKSGGINRNANKRLTRMVGGAYVVGSLENANVSVGMLYAETVGGAKLTLVPKGSLSQTVAGYHAVTVGGVLLRKAKGDITYTSPKSSVKTAALTSFESKKKLEIRAKQITIEATATLGLVAGAAKVEADTGQMALVGEVRLDAPNKVQIVGSPTDIDKAGGGA